MIRPILVIFLTTGFVRGAEVSFNREVRPILSENCFSCHGADAAGRKAGLRLDTREGATAPGKEDRAAVVPGEPARSELWARVSSEDADEAMPPPSSHKQLTDSQRETLRRWIEAGAPYERHWSFVPPHRTDPPGPSRREGVANAIDRFVHARLEAEGLSPSPPADPAALLRRVSLDLTGLPPDAETARAFLADPGEAAYEALVDRLLASPHFGEHLAVAWLDAARYADTNGYFGDKPRQMWLWRDWVVAAFNENLPFDRFTLEQLAGDLLPAPTTAQRIATGFNRNHMANNETGIDDEEFRVEYVVDRVDATMSTWQGLTAACAQCHDHKFDPISQREFYGLFAFFNKVPEQGLIRADDPPPLLLVPSPEQERGLARLAAEVKAAREVFEAKRPALKGALEAWETNATSTLPEAPAPALLYESFDGSSTGRVAGGETLEGATGILGEAGRFDATRHLELDAGAFDPDGAWTIGFWAKAESSLGCPLSLVEPTGDRRGLEILLQKGRVQVNLVHRWGDSAIEILALEAGETSEEALEAGGGEGWRHVAVAYDGSRRAEGLRVHLDGRPAEIEVRRDLLGGSIANAEPLRIGRRDSGLGYYGLLDEVRIVAGAVGETELRAWVRGERLRGILGRKESDRSERAREILLNDYLAHHSDPTTLAARRRLKQAIAEEKSLRDSIPSVLVMEEMETPRPTHVLERGLYDQPGERVEPHAPAAVAPWPEGAPPNRLGLAQWLLAPENPLTARVAANRLWSHCFGEGLVRTPDDFGSQGEPPTHPELLDHLALSLREGGWNLKALLREIVLSRTYRQDSALSYRDGEVLDPENRLLARGPGGRLSAEMLRDQALAVSGLLVPKVGGPSVKPYQPPGLWEEVSYDAEERYLADAGEGLWRRSLYTYVKRQAPPPSLLNFDGPTREKCSVRRGRTSTPLQALQLLNDPTYLEAARILAGEVLRGPGLERDRLRALWRRLLVREADETELAALAGLLERQRHRFAGDAAAADTLLSVGAAPRGDGPASGEHAAWTIVAHALLNLDETLTKP
jgi:hypothetical protein